MRVVQLAEERIADMTALWNKEWAGSLPMRERLLRQNMLMYCKFPHFYAGKQIS